MPEALAHDDEPNPYAPPETDAEKPVVYEQCVRRGRVVIVPRGMDLPPRCIKCNAPPCQPIQRVTVHWFPRWVFFILILGYPGLYVGAIVILASWQTASLSPGLCEVHTARRRKIMGLALISTVLVASGAYASIVGALSPLLWVTTGVGGLGLLVTLWLCRLVRPCLINSQVAEIKGCGQPFLDSLPWAPPRSPWEAV